MRLTPHKVQTPTYTQDAYGDPTPTYGTATDVLMFVGWLDALRNNVEGTIYQKYDFVGITKADVPVDALIDGALVVGYTDKSGRFNRLFMNYAEGADRIYG